LLGPAVRQREVPACAGDSIRDADGRKAAGPKAGAAGLRFVHDTFHRQHRLRPPPLPVRAQPAQFRRAARFGNSRKPRSSGVRASSAPPCGARAVSRSQRRQTRLGEARSMSPRHQPAACRDGPRSGRRRLQPHPTCPRDRYQQTFLVCVDWHYTFTTVQVPGFSVGSNASTLGIRGAVSANRLLDARNAMKMSGSFAWFC